MFSNSYSHINEAFSIIKKLLNYDPDIYSDLILSYCEGDAWQWGNDNVETFFRLCDFFSSPKVFADDPDINLYYKLVDNEIILSDNENDYAFKDIVDSIKNKIYDDLKALRVASVYHNAMIKFIGAELSFKEISKRHNIEKVSGNSSQPAESVFFKTVKDRWKGKDIKPFLLYCQKAVLDQNYLVNINAKLFYHLIKSFLNGEYLIFNEYSKRIKEFDENGDENLGEFTVYSIKSFIKSIWLAEEICSIIRTTIDNPKSDKIIVRVNTDKESRSKTQFSLKQRTLFGESDTIDFEILMELVIDMTLIDHVYISNIDNAQKLKQIEQQVDIIRRNYYMRMAPTEKEPLEKALSMLREKAKYLYEGMIISEHNDFNEYVFIIDGKIHHYMQRDAEDYRNKLYKIRQENPILKLKFEKINQTIDKAQELIPSCDIYNGSRSDIRDYNKSIAEAINAHIELSSFYKKVVNINNLRVSCQEIKEIMGIYKEYRRPSFYIHSIKSLVIIIEKLFNEEKASEKEIVDRIGDKIELLRELLGDLYIYIKKCNSQIVSAQFRPYFANSFYSISKDEKGENVIFYSGDTKKADIDNYDYRNFEGKFFFASIACNPISPTYLEYFRSKYDDKRRELSARHSALSIKHNDEHVSEQFETWNTSIKTTLNDNQRHVVTVLGIFASLIAFAAISIGIIEVVTDIKEYFLFVLSFTVGVSIFASLVLPNEKEKKFYQKPHYIICGLLIILAIIFGLLHFYPSTNEIL